MLLVLFNNVWHKIDNDFTGSWIQVATPLWIVYGIGGIVAIVYGFMKGINDDDINGYIGLFGYVFVGILTIWTYLGIFTYLDNDNWLNTGHPVTGSLLGGCIIFIGCCHIFNSIMAFKSDDDTRPIIVVFIECVQTSLAAGADVYLGVMVIRQIDYDYQFLWVNIIIPYIFCMCIWSILEICIGLCMFWHQNSLIPFGLSLLQTLYWSSEYVFWYFACMFLDNNHVNGLQIVIPKFVSCGILAFGAVVYGGGAWYFYHTSKSHKTEIIQMQVLSV